MAKKKKVKSKKKLVRKKKVTKQKRGETAKGQAKYHRGGRVEAYTMGETLGKEDWP